MPMAYAPVLMLSYLKHATQPSWGAPHDQVTEVEKSGAWFTDSFAPYECTTWK